jgi:hypothetical protein
LKWTAGSILQGRNSQFVAKAENKDQKTQEKQRKKHYLRHDTRCFVSAEEKNWQYTAKFVQDGVYVGKIRLQSLYCNTDKV